MYRTNDPRFRRRLNELGQTLESANETAQSSIYIFGQNYIRPCLDSVGSCLTTCVDASCPSLNLSQRDRIRRQRGRGRSTGRAESSFDFYDDWDEDENDGLLGWSNDEFDRLVGAGNGTDSNTGGAGYGTLATNTQPGRTGNMAYQPKVSKRKGTLLPGEMGAEPPVIAKPTFFSRLFGGKSLRYKPSAADLQDHPGTLRLGRNITEGEALLADLEDDDPRGPSRRQRLRSGTTGSADTRDSYSSRGDLFPSDEEFGDDAIPLDDEFAMVLERRILGSGADTENSSGRSHSDTQNRYSSGSGRLRGKRTTSNRSRASTRRTLSTRSSMSGRIGSGSRVASGASLAEILPELRQSQQIEPQSLVVSPELTRSPEAEMPSLSDLKLEERVLEREEEADVERRRHEAHVLALSRGLTSVGGAREEDVVEDMVENLPGDDGHDAHRQPSGSEKEATPLSIRDKNDQDPDTTAMIPSVAEVEAADNDSQSSTRQRPRSHSKQENDDPKS